MTDIRRAGWERLEGQITSHSLHRKYHRSKIAASYGFWPSRLAAAGWSVHFFIDRKYDLGSGIFMECLKFPKLHAFIVMNYRAASRAVSQIATPKNYAASCGVFIIPRKRDKESNSILYLFILFGANLIEGYSAFIIYQNDGFNFKI